MPNRCHHAALVLSIALGTSLAAAARADCYLLATPGRGPVPVHEICVQENGRPRFVLMSPGVTRFDPATGRVVGRTRIGETVDLPVDQVTWLWIPSGQGDRGAYVRPDALHAPAGWAPRGVIVAALRQDGRRLVFVDVKPAIDTSARVLAWGDDPADRLAWDDLVWVEVEAQASRHVAAAEGDSLLVVIRPRPAPAVEAADSAAVAAESLVLPPPRIVPGARVRIAGPGQRRASGRVTAADDGLLVVDLDSGETVTCAGPCDWTVEVRTARHGNSGKGAVIGAVVVGLGGLALGVAIAADDFFDAGGEAVAGGAILGATVGGLLGALVGSVVVTEDWAPAEPWQAPAPSVPPMAAGPRVEGRVGVRLAF
ncbi:MAG TPA: hypothetical protein PLQ13_07920 [Candidatus Krumholzibacteria bacterium]|nr:hypothetical protein [Candidatus Krumholzibacteria bacterium]